MVVYPDGMTVRQLKHMLESWPDIDDNGRESCVMIRTDRTTCVPVVAAGLFGQDGGAAIAFIGKQVR